jgi:deoxyribodipyrimidine photo-lyase
LPWNDLVLGGSEEPGVKNRGFDHVLAEQFHRRRVRMIVASFLVKALHIEWTRGARHFWQHLVDGDLASNQHGWQWTVGTGADAAPYFRIFNRSGRAGNPIPTDLRPPLRARITRPVGTSVHKPWEHPDGVRVRHVERIVDHAAGRARSPTELPAGARPCSARAGADRAFDRPRLTD